MPVFDWTTSYGCIHPNYLYKQGRAAKQAIVFDSSYHALRTLLCRTPLILS